MSEEKTNPAALVTLDFNGAKIRSEGDWTHATDMWRAAGAPANKHPRFWLRQQATQKFVDALASDDVSQDHIIRTERGAAESRGGGGTWFCRELAIAYAAYVDAPFHVFLVRTFLAATDPRPTDTVRIAAPTFDVAALAKHVADLVCDRMRALPAPSVTVNAYEADAFEEERGRTAAVAADVVLARLFVTADPAKPIGKHVASAIASQIRDFARIESAGLVPGAEGGAPAAREAIYRSLVSRAQSDMREAVRCGRAAYAKLPGVYLAPMREWLGVWGARLAREHSKPPTPAEQRTLFVVASNDSSKRGA